MNEDLINKSAFLHFNILPEICIHSVIEDEYSKMYVPRKICDCGCDEWLEEGCTMILAYVNDRIPVYKDVHRCKKCNKIRMAKHIGCKD